MAKARPVAAADPCGALAPGFRALISAFAYTDASAREASTPVEDCFLLKRAQFPFDVLQPMTPR
jgi:hypothetical protein